MLFPKVANNLTKDMKTMKLLLATQSSFIYRSPLSILYAKINTMASVKVFPRLDKVNSEGKAPVYLRVIKHRKSKYIALDVYVLRRDWNKETGKVKSTAHNASQINSYISSKVAEAERIVLEMETRSTSVTAYVIKHKILGRAPKDFFEYVENRKDIMDKAFTIGTIRRYKCAVKKLRSFCKRDSLYFDDINVTLIRDFQQNLLFDCKNHVNTVNANLKVIRRLLFDAVAEGLLPFEKNPFNKIKLRGQSTKQTFLLDHELELLEKLELSKDSQLNHHRNLYIFSAYSCGIRISDLLMMRWKNVSGDRLYFQFR
jgi:integrase/recombinase XerD